MKGLIKLGGLRVASVALSLIANIFCVKVLSGRELGFYYTFGSIAYFGNALFFIGFDFALQRKLRSLSLHRLIDFSSIWLPVKNIAPFGFFATLGLSILLSQSSLDFESIGRSLLAACLTVSTFLLTLSRNILLIGGKKKLVANSLFIEQAAKLILCYISVFVFKPSALSFIAAVALASLLAAVVNYKYMLASLMPSATPIDYRMDSDDARHTFLPVSASAVLNWVQLQGYRPALVQILDMPQIVGSVSFLASLGGVAVSATLGTLSQLRTAKQFSTGGASSKQFFLQALAITILLSIVSYPASFLFLRLIGKSSFYGLELLVPLGVVMEGSNFMLGILGNHASLTIRSFVPSMFSALVASIFVALAISVLNGFHLLSPIYLGFALAMSQCIAVAMLVPVLAKRG